MNVDKEYFIVEKIEDALEEYKKLYNVDFSHPVPLKEFVENTSYILCYLVDNLDERETTPHRPETYHIIRVNYTHFIKKNNICIYFFKKEGEQFAYSFSNICFEGEVESTKETQQRRETLESKTKEFENKNAIIFHYTEEYPCK